MNYPHLRDIHRNVEHDDLVDHRDSKEWRQARCYPLEACT